MKPDPTALWTARNEVRRAYAAIRRMRERDDPVLRDLLDRLDELCVGLTARIEAIEPEMELRDVWAPERAMT